MQIRPLCGKSILLYRSNLLSDCSNFQVRMRDVRDVRQHNLK